MENETTQDELNVVAEEPTVDNNKTVGDKSLTNENESLDKEGIGSPSQSDISPVGTQTSFGRTSSRKSRGTATQIILYAALLLIGFVLGALGMLLFQLSIGGTRSPITSTLTPVASGNVTVHADQSIIIPLLQNSVQTIDLPANGSVSNVQVQFINGDQMNITGNYQASVLGIPVTQPFSLNAQLIVDNCQVQIHILQANFSNIPVTGLVALFEDRINQKLAQLIPQNNLPGNVEFCLINIATDEQGISATFNLVVPSTSTPTARVEKPIAFL